MNYLTLTFLTLYLTTGISAMENDQNESEKIRLYQQTGDLITPTNAQMVIPAGMKFNDGFFEKYPSDVYKATIVHILHDIENCIELNKQGSYVTIASNDGIPSDAKKVIPLSEKQNKTIQPKKVFCCIS